MISLFLFQLLYCQTREELVYSPIYPQTKLRFPADCIDEKTTITMQVVEPIFVYHCTPCVLDLMLS